MSGDETELTLKEALVDELIRKEAIHTPEVEAAFRAVPRHLFVPQVNLHEAYSDRSIPTKWLGDELVSSSSQPAIMAIMLEQLELEPGHKVLEIGAGTGYNAALIAHIVGEGGQVVTVDIDKDIVKEAREQLRVAGFAGVQVVCADGGHGYADAAPFDRIILTVAAPDIAAAWREQLNPAGRLVLPLQIRGIQRAIAFDRSDDHLTSTSVKACGFMPLRGALAALSPELVLQVGPDPDLFIESHEQIPIDAERIYGWLTSGGSSWRTGIEVTAVDAVFGGLRLWLEMHEARVGQLVAKADTVERDLVPSLFGLGGVWKSVFTVILVGKAGIAALMRPPGQTVSLVDINELERDSAAFPLHVRQYGSDESPARRLVEHVKAWDAAGRPASNQLSVQAYPKKTTYIPSGNEQVIEKEWTRLILEWQ